MRAAAISISCLVSLVAVPARDAAADKPSFAVGHGLSIESSDSGVAVVRRGKSTAPLGESGYLDDVKVDKAAGTISLAIESTCGARLPVVRFSYDQLEARLANAAAYALHRKKRYAAAAKGFARAAALDPDLEIAATNLASALQLLGKRDEAVAALAPWIARTPVEVYAKVAVDPELAPLLDAPALVALRAAGPGTATISADGVISRTIALAPDRHLFAMVRGEASWGACTGRADVELLDATTGAVVASLPVFAMDDWTGDCDHPALTAAGKRAVAARVAVAQRVLTDLGFAPAPFEDAGATARIADPDKELAHFAKARLGVVVANGTGRVLRGNTVLAEGPVLYHLDHAWYVDALRVVIVMTSRSGAEGCESTDPTKLTILPLR